MIMIIGGSPCSGKSTTAELTPQVMKNRGYDRYICMIPEPDFQVSHYKEREWVSYVPEGCSDKEKAFENRMQRNMLFAEQIKRECAESGIPCLINDGSRSEREILGIVKNLFAV